MSKQPTNIRAQLVEHLKELRLPAMRECYEQEAQRAQQETLSYEQYLFELAGRECETRRQHRVERFLRESRLPIDKSLDAFDIKRLPRKVAQHVRTLLDGSFLDRRENVMAFGNPGSGKTHLLCALGQELIRAGRRIYFAPTALLVQDLLRAKQELKLARLLKRLAKYDALILDDIGYVQHDRDEMEVLFTLLAERYERGSVMLTTNLPFSQWERIFKDPMTTAAAIDRLVHHSIILELNIQSYRVHAAKNKEKESA
jgi:DNA replication protein DnaC